MKTHFKQIGKDSVVYGLGGLISKAVALFLVPVYTRIFSPEAFGTIEMLTVLNALLGAILVMGMDSALSFYFFEQKNNGQAAQARVVSAVLQWKLVWGVGIVGIATVLSPLMNMWLFDGQLDVLYFGIAFLAALFAQVMSQSAEVFRLLYRPWNYITITLCQTLASAAIALTLIILLGFGVLGFFVGMLAGAVLASIIGWWGIRDYLDFSQVHRNWWPKLLKFGAPLVPAGMAMYVLNTADRWFVNYYHGQSALGLYAVGAKFAVVVSVAVATFRLAWWPIAMESIHGGRGEELFRLIARFYLGIGVVGVVLLTAISPHLVGWIAAPEYFDAYPMVGVLAWSPIFYGFYLIGAAGIWKAEKTKWAPLLMAVAAGLNIVLDVWLVPAYGGLGAALATAISFCIWNLLALIVSEKLWRVGYDYGIMALQIGLGGTACYGILTIYQRQLAPWYAWFVTLLAGTALVALSIERGHLGVVFERANRIVVACMNRLERE
jgi:O-antigen/teichoic acid export membrane protein